MKPNKKTLHVLFDSLGDSVSVSIESNDPGYQFIIGKLLKLDILDRPGSESSINFAEAARAVCLYRPELTRIIERMQSRAAKQPDGASDPNYYVVEYVSAAIGREAC